jgi:hypothetical protein
MIQRYIIIHGSFYSNTHKYVCVSVMIFLYVVRVHSFRICSLFTMGYLLNLCFSINSGIPLYYNTEYFVSVSCPFGVSLPPSQHIP